VVAGPFSVLPTSAFWPQWLSMQTPLWHQTMWHSASALTAVSDHAFISLKGWVCSCRPGCEPWPAKMVKFAVPIFTAIGWNMIETSCLISHPFVSSLGDSDWGLKAAHQHHHHGLLQFHACGSGVGKVLNLAEISNFCNWLCAWFLPKWCEGLGWVLGGLRIAAAHALTIHWGYPIE
jgi:hypothetical protein